MAQSEHLPIYKRGYELCLYLEQVARGFSRSNRALGDEFRTGSRRVLCLVVRARSRREQAAQDGPGGRGIRLRGAGLRAYEPEGFAATSGLPGQVPRANRRAI